MRDDDFSSSKKYLKVFRSHHLYFQNKLKFQKKWNNVVFLNISNSFMHLYYLLPSKLKYFSISRTSLSKECRKFLALQKIPKHIFVFTPFYIIQQVKIHFCSWFLTDLLICFIKEKTCKSLLFFLSLQQNILCTPCSLMHFLFTIQSYKFTY